MKKNLHPFAEHAPHPEKRRGFQYSFYERFSDHFGFLKEVHYVALSYFYTINAKQFAKG
ncbi:hypothetical protein [Acinetobacter sp. CWB-B33]|uniref:hypothetical protein n=1 Tax=Acinetobacter sp. CWB-B33 TaxID=2815724 RepID=UPI0031FF331C